MISSFTAFFKLSLMNTDSFYNKKKTLYFKNQIFLELKTGNTFLLMNFFFLNTERVNSYKMLAIVIDDVSNYCFVIIIRCKQYVTHHLGR